MKFRFNQQKLTDYLRSALILVLLGVEILLCAEAIYEINSEYFVALVCCCVVLLIVEAVNEFVLRQFILKAVFYTIAALLSFAICLLTGNSYLAVIYCIVLTGLYCTVETFKDRTILFGCGCGLYFISFVGSRLIIERSLSIYQALVATVSGLFGGLFAILLDYVVVQFIIKYYNTNKELSKALAAADKSREQLEAAYEQLTVTRLYEERNRIAKDIHDNAGHSMTTVIMQTEAAKLLIDKNPEEAKARIISANLQAKNALEQMRDSVHLLAGNDKIKPVGEEIQNIIVQTMDGTGVRIRSDIADFETSEQTRRFLCNSLKELFSNGIRHGKASAFYVELANNGSIIKLLVSDNGTGVSGAVKEGFGLRGIREKAEKMGGTCCFTGEEDEGFEVTIILPDGGAEVKND